MADVWNMVMIFMRYWTKSWFNSLEIIFTDSMPNLSVPGLWARILLHRYIWDINFIFVKWIRGDFWQICIIAVVMNSLFLSCDPMFKPVNSRSGPRQVPCKWWMLVRPGRSMLTRNFSKRFLGNLAIFTDKSQFLMRKINYFLVTAIVQVANRLTVF